MANRIDTAELSRAINGWSAVVDAASWPTGSSTVYGGSLKTQYTVNGVERVSAALQIVKRTEWNYSIARFYVSQIAGGTDTLQNTYFDFMSNGNVTFGGRLYLGSPAPGDWISAANGHYSGVYLPYTQDNPGNSAIGALSWGYQHSGGYNLRTMWGNVGNGTNGWANTSMTQYADGGSAMRYWYFTPTTGDLSTTVGGNGGFAGSYIFQKAATSDATLKHDIAYDDGKASYENIKKLKPCTFVYNGDYLERVRRGIIAQDALRDIDSEYVKLVPAAPEFDEEGNRCDKDDTLALDNNVVMMDTALALHHAIAKIETLTAQVAQLQSEVQALKA
ncbi:tail fiber domain-containing protein [Enterobacter sp. MF024]|uniref:tail fiber domain-containing protein n=1 Tax=Enterobacter sp. MF024 TaxID=2555644 RepID=UPI001105F901|nr:tail fiber domain-containing protein [Enterobacter sp. MF024]TLU69685.1 tail fiber domain-containing protein [Enterobacter sp. MF024]